MKSSFRLVVTILLIFLRSIAMFSQEISTIQWTTDSESLPQNSIKSIAPDRYGFLWMTTENGLVRFDGKDFKVFDNGNIGVKNNRFLHIRGIPQTDTLYTSTENEEDFVLITHRTAKKILLKNHPEARFIDKKNEAFLSHGVPSIFFDEPTRACKIVLPSKNYYLIANQQIQLFNAKHQLQFRHKFQYDSNSNFFTSGETLFHINPLGGYSSINKNSIQQYQFEWNPQQKIILYWNSVAQQAFISVNENLYYLTAESDKLTPQLIAENLNLVANAVWSVYFSPKDQTIFLGSTKKGLGIFKSKLFNVVMPSNSQNSEYNEVFYALERFTDSTVISASGLLMNDKKIIENLNFRSDKYDILKDNNEDIWVSAGTILYRYKKSNSYKNPDFWQFSNDISTIFLAQDGKIWFDLSINRGTTGRLYSFFPNEQPNFLRIFDLNFKINFLAQNDSRYLWIGSKKGLHKLDLTKKKLYAIENTEHLKIRSIYISKDNNIWLTTYEKGFFLYKSNKLYPFPLDKNNFLLSSHCIVEDNNGYFWISTNKGLFQVSEKSLLNFSEKKIEQIYYHYYNKRRGFISNEFNGGCQPCGVKLENGRIFFPSMSGVVSFIPEYVKPIVPDKDIYIEEARINGKKMPIGQTVNLDYDFQRITFFVTTPFFGNQKNLFFEAKLVGPESQKWIEISKENSVSFSNLPPGQYELTVRKLSGFDSNYKYATVIINVKPAFWQTVWFTVVMIVTILLLIFLIYKLRTAYIKNENVLLEKIINEKTTDLKSTITTLRTTKDNLNQVIENNNKIIQFITHDIKSPLRFMTMAIKHMYDSYETEKDDLRENIKSIYTSSTQMFNFVDNLLEYSKIHLKNEIESDVFSLSNVISAKIDLFDVIAISQKTIIKNLIPEAIVLNVNRQLFTIIIHNLLDNAVKHTLHGTIIFSIYIQKNKIFLLITDSGQGIQKEKLQYYQNLTKNYDIKSNRMTAHMGLQIVMELMLILNGEITIDSEENKGTTVTLIFDNPTGTIT